MYVPRLKDINWIHAGWFKFVHFGAMFALLPFTFSWLGLSCFLVLWWLTGGVGVCLGYHRCLTHRSFKTHRPIRWTLAWLGTQSGEGDPIKWASRHRVHHECSDKDGDPHSPHMSRNRFLGFLWSHIGWTLAAHKKNELVEQQKRYVPDLLQDAGLRFIGRMQLVSHTVVFAGLFLLGWQWNLSTALSCVVWGFSFRIFFVLHCTWLINSVTHLWGYRTHQTKDKSRNLWWVAVLTFGEGWHNNHHHNPTSAAHGHRWWELDLTYLTIRGMEFLGLAWDVKRSHA